MLFDVGTDGVGFAFGNFFAFAERAVEGSFAANGVEDFEREAGGINVIVAAGAGFVGAVLGELVADGDCAADVGLDGGDAGGRGRDGFGKDLIEDPDSPQDGRGVGAIGGHFENAGLGEEAAADGVVGDFHDFGIFVSLDSGDAVVTGEAFVEDGEIGVDEVGDGKVVFEEVAEEAFGFPDHRLLEHGVEFGEEFFGRRGEFDLAKAEPLTGEVFEEAFASGIVEHAFDLGVTDPGVGEFAGSGEVKELLVGHGGPQEIGELGGEGVVVGFFLAVQEEEPG